MSEKVQVLGGTRINGKIHHKVKIKGEVFDHVPNIPKCEECTRTKCKNYWN